jgi:hypothetical protein
MVGQRGERRKEGLPVIVRENDKLSCIGEKETCL